jgi:hypothetical protein
MEDKVIKIACEAKENIPLDDFNSLQGNLKEMHEDNFEKLKHIDRSSI